MPSPGPSGTLLCGRLHRTLPADLDGRPAVPVRPPSRLTAAWRAPGDRPVVLRCGVARPAGLRPTSQVIEVDGVEWFLAAGKDAYVFTTVGRTTYVEVRVPTSVAREEATAPLVDLAHAVSASIPTATPSD